MIAAAKDEAMMIKLSWKSEKTNMIHYVIGDPDDILELYDSLEQVDHVFNLRLYDLTEESTISIDRLRRRKEA